MLEGLYWTKDSQTNTPGSYQDYLTRYADGPHAAAASKGIEDLKRAEDEAKENQRFQEASNSSDEATLRALLKDHPSGPQHDKIYGRLDDVIWGKTRTDDVAGLRAYVEKMSDGKYVSQAREQIEKLTEAAKPPQRTQPTLPPPTITVDERKAVLAILDQYKKAYENKNVPELVRLGPAVGDPRQFEAFFKRADSVRWDYLLIGEPQFDGNQAIVTLTESFSYVLDNRPIKQQKKTVMRLTKGASGAWTIQSIQRK